ncbi:MAG: right-handed parallel beta-helix repeat-containing protein [Planctomycetes bacterium]|nr:right-handed parallel beta-helix repeat-containing protein [Planctomycetota bacterium]
MAIGIAAPNASAQGTPPTINWSGPQGGPFPTATTVLPVANPMALTVRWRAFQSTPWLTATATSRTIAPNGTLDITVGIDPTAAASLAVGSYTADIAYRDRATLQWNVLWHLVLDVQPAQLAVDVAPAAPLQVQGPQGGPFSPMGANYTLTNTGNVPVSWGATSDQTWASIAGSNVGLLSPGQSAIVHVDLDSGVLNAFQVGSYTATLDFRRRSDGLLLGSRTIALTVDPAAPASGWTPLSPSPDTRSVFVSSSTGNDANNGLSSGTPKRTIAAAKALLRNGYPDWLLLKCGDTWDESLGQWIVSGRSSTEPTVITNYGTGERPYLRTGNGDGITAIAAGTSPSSINNVAIVGLHMKAHTYVGNGEPSGVNWMIQSSGLLVEDCLIEGYQINVSVPGYGGHKYAIQVRRNVIADAFSTTGTVGHGIYMANAHDVLIEENVLDHNGWSETVPGATPSIFRHGIYIQSGSGTCSNVTVRRNIIANSASHGLHLRPGGVAEDNLFLRNSISLSLGGGNEPNPGGVSVVARGNVVLDGKNIDAANPRGWGIDLANINSGTVAYNIVANQTLASFPIPFNLYGNSSGLGVHDTVFEHNIVSNWGGSVNVAGTSTQLTSILFRNNDFNSTIDTDQLIEHTTASNTAAIDSVQNRFFSINVPTAWMRSGSTNLSLSGWKNLVGDTTSTTIPTGAYADPGRTIATYNQSLGGAASYSAFMTEARRQSKANWRPQYSASAAIGYFRAGFGLVVP